MTEVIKRLYDIKEGCRDGRFPALPHRALQRIVEMENTPVNDSLGYFLNGHIEIAKIAIAELPIGFSVLTRLANQLN
jgi:hypothetical protein